MPMLQSKDMVDGEVQSERVRPLKRIEYERLVELGAFQDERIELLRGVLVAMTPQGPVHADVAAFIADILNDALRGHALIRCHSPFAASDDSEPEPDVAVYPRRRYFRAHPTLALLLVEVADSSLRQDRVLKAEIYAEAGVPEYWVVDVARGVVEVRTEPVAGQYGRLVTIARGESIALAAFPDVAVAGDDFLPPA